ncbi:A/G-specific adenine glycosylase [Marinicrinis lubricantis]|uniref:Adenine DNA glycosylase n=1 Tax=Marinicrinis lubricantis TaxID=2086470 RepID=A0ABW1IRB1_9BACL
MTTALEKKQYFVHSLLAWFRAYQRDLPWRRTKDPYRIWVSEIMLQQTRVDTVIPYYERFLERFPTVEALADAPEEEVLKLWEGLGYYSRARNLQSAVREVRDTYNGVVPDDRQHFSSLKGVGPYTTGAVLSIAYNRPEPAVDGNVMRVLSRYFLIEEDIMKGSTRAHMEHLIREMIPHDAAGDFNQALMELGALICTPKSPQCLVCPVMEQCTGRLEGKEEQLPIKKKAKAPRPEYRIAAMVGSVEGEKPFLIRQRSGQGLLANMWELPHMEYGKGMEELSEAGEQEALARHIQAETGLIVKPHGFLMNAEHTFSHIHWNMKVYAFEIVQQHPLPDHYRWIRKEEMQHFAFPNIFLRIIGARQS